MNQKKLSSLEMKKQQKAAQKEAKFEAAIAKGRNLLDQFTSHEDTIHLRAVLSCALRKSYSMAIANYHCTRAPNPGTVAAAWLCWAAKQHGLPKNQRMFIPLKVSQKAVWQCEEAADVDGVCDHLCGFATPAGAVLPPSLVMGVAPAAPAPAPIPVPSLVVVIPPPPTAPVVLEPWQQSRPLTPDSVLSDHAGAFDSSDLDWSDASASMPASPASTSSLPDLEDDFLSQSGGSWLGNASGGESDESDDLPELAPELPLAFEPVNMKKRKTPSTEQQLGKLNETQKLVRTETLFDDGLLEEINSSFNSSFDPLYQDQSFYSSSFSMGSRPPSPLCNDQMFLASPGYIDLAEQWSSPLEFGRYE